MIVYCNGDSFVAGSELGDDILPEYPGLLDFPWDPTPGKTHKNFEEWYIKSHKENNHIGIERFKNQRVITKLDFERAFPNKLEKLIGIRVINHSRPGTSMDKIVRTSMSDLMTLTKTHSNIVAVIGNTGLARSEVACAKHIEIQHNQVIPSVWRCISSTYRLPHDTDELNCLLDYKLIYEKNYHHYVNFYKNVILLQDFCKLKNIKLLWLATIEDHTKINIEKEFIEAQDLKNFIEYADLKYTINMSDIANNIKTQTVCPSGHYSELVHEEVAKQLVVKIQQL